MTDLFINVDLYDYIIMGLSLNNGPKPSNTAGAPPLSPGALKTSSVENPLKSKL